MPIYVSMLRGINVGPHKRIKMDRLRECFKEMGFKDVSTYIQSGNVVFRSGKTSTAALSNKIGLRITTDFGFPVPVVSRTFEELEPVVHTNPLLPGRCEGANTIDPEKLHVTFLSETPSASALNKLADLTLMPEKSCCLGNEIYLYLPNGVSNSPLIKASLDRILSVVATTRNWKTVRTLHQMCKELR